MFFGRFNYLFNRKEGYTIPVHNEGIARFLRPHYTSEQFSELFEFAKKKNVFRFVMNDKTNSLKTSLINRKENPLMSDLLWDTDSCHNMELLKAYYPEACTPALNKLADLYEGQKEVFDRIISNPEIYHQNPTYVWQGQVGVGHCYDPKTNKPHHWFPKTRLESIGNYLQQASDIVLTGLSGGKYGYKTAEEIPAEVVDSVANCTKYLHAIHYPTARSCTAWEEHTFETSATSDTSICNQGIRKILQLMYEPTQNAELLKLRNRILKSKHGDIFEDKNVLIELLKSGEKRIIDMPNKEVSSKVPLGERPKIYVRLYDSAMAFMPQTEKLDPKNIYSDSAKKLFILKLQGKNLVRENGAIRYLGDTYLNLDYHKIKNKWTDNKRQNEAEWFLVSEFSSAYGAVVKQLLEHIERKGSINKKDKKLLKMALKGEMEYINRSYARITPKNAVKSNGYSCPAYSVPEAYEAITTKSGKVKFVPGAHNPLTWAEASLQEASEMMLSNLRKFEELY